VSVPATHGNGDDDHSCASSSSGAESIASSSVGTRKANTPSKNIKSNNNKRPPRVLVHVDVRLPGGRSDRLTVRTGQALSDVVARFAHKHNLDERRTHALSNLVQGALDDKAHRRQGYEQ
jgi:hypothetical protein